MNIRRAIPAAITCMLLATALHALPGDFLFLPFTGEQKMLVIFVDYTAEAECPSTGLYQNGEVMPLISQLNALVDANSYKTATIEARATLAYTRAPDIVLDGSECHYRAIPGDGGGRVTIREEVVDKLAILGVDVYQYDRELILSRPQAWQGRSAHGTGNNRSIFISEGANLSGWLWGHEVGHSYRWRHSNFREIDDDAVDCHPLAEEAKEINYGDRYDVMGDVTQFHHFNPWWKLRAGWLELDEVTEVQTSGTVRLRAIEVHPDSPVPANATSAIRLRRSPEEDFWIYWRRDEDQVDDGVMISIGSRSNVPGSLLLDMTPKSLPQDHLDAQLKVGESFNTEVDGTGNTVTLVELTESSASVDIQIADEAAQAAMDTLPVVDVRRPLRGVTVTQPTIARATAYDPDVGPLNGDGIFAVKFTVGRQEVDTFVPIYSAFDTSPPYESCLATHPLGTQIYILRVEGIACGDPGCTGPGPRQIHEYKFFADPEPPSGGAQLYCDLPAFE